MKVSNLRIRLVPALLVALLAASAARAHEFWIAPREWRVEPGATIAADFRVGQMFAGRDLRFFPTDTARHEAFGPPGTEVKRARSGDKPAMKAAAPAPGLVVLVHQTTPETLRYQSADLFENFVRHKDLRGVLAAHKARGLPPSGFVEHYTRFAKALVAVGAGHGADRAVGMRTELVALANPYTDDLSAGLAVQLFFEGAPLADAQVELFDRAPDGTVRDLFFRTDAQGVAVLPVESGHEYLVDAVRMLPLEAADPANDPVWHSLWASLTFAVP